MSQLTPSQYKLLDVALNGAFPSVASLAAMAKYALGIDLADEVDISQPKRYVVFYLIQWTEAHDKSIKLIAGAREANPDNVRLFELASQFGLAPGIATLESLIVKSKLPIDIAKWSEREGRIEPRICHILVGTNGGTLSGTGFLISKDVVMTNYHVVEPQIAAREGKATASGLTGSPEGVSFRFDYKRSADGTVTNPGHEVRLTTTGEWLLDSSPYSQLDLQEHSRGVTPGPNELDYALLRLNEAAGEHTLGTGPLSYQRGWLTPSEHYQLQVSEPLIIMQHPRGRPLEIAGDAVLDINQDRTRITYRTNTEPGSSGSPCFTFNWDLVALHHFGDRETPFHNPEYNQGIPFSAILKRMVQQGTNKHIGEKLD